MKLSRFTLLLVLATGASALAQTGPAPVAAPTSAAPAAVPDSTAVVPAPDATDPKSVIKSAVDQVLTVLRDPAMQDPARRADRIDRVRRVVDAVFDWSAMAQSSLGVHWRKLDTAQRERFVLAFRDVLAAEYVTDFDKFRGDEQVSIDALVESGDLRQVKTTVVTHSRERVPVDYWLHRTGERWVVGDFSVEGISIVNHYRGSFSRYMTNHTFDDLMQTLERRRRVLNEVLKAPAAP